MKQSAMLFVCLFISLCSWGCGGGDDEDFFFDDAGVDDIDVDDSTIHAGGSTIVRVNFSYSASDVFENNERIVVVVRLPPELRYREGTAEIQTTFGSDDEVDPQGGICSDSGETFLVFDLDDRDLSDAENPGGDADAQLSLTVDALVPGGNVVIDATARERSVAFSCGQSFFSDAHQVLGIF